MLEQTSANDIGFTTGDNLFIGANQVSPNGASGTTGTATSSDGTVLNLSFRGNTAFPNQISNGTENGDLYVPGTSDPNLLNPWTLNFQNGANQTAVVTPSLVGVTPSPFASNVTISGNGANPTFTWSGSGDTVFINIYDKNLCSDRTAGTSNAQCAAHGGWPDAVLNVGGLSANGSYTVTGTLLGALDPSHKYVLEISETTLRPVSERLSGQGHHNESAIARAEFDFTVLPAGSPPSVTLPIEDAAGVYHFNQAVVAGQPIFIDPLLVTGYDYQIGAGDPNFACVTLPAVQSSPYDLSFSEGSQRITDLLSANTQFCFPTGGVSEFDVTGIDAADGLDPNDPTAFITELTFVSSGTFTGTMTPMVASVPEPWTLALFASGLLGLGFVRRRMHV